jgi:hypothetical protein
VSRSNRKQARARERIARNQAEEAQRRRQRLWLAGISAAVVVIAAVIGIALAVTSGG